MPGDPAAATDLTAATNLTGPGGIDLDRVTVAGLQRAMNSGAFTSAELTGCYLERIRLLNPVLRAVIAVHPDAMVSAEASDASRSEGRPPRPLEGIPVLIKDNIAVAGLPTTAGSLALSASAPPDAFCVARLREAGAVIIGKANLSEWANFRSQHSSSGWSSVGGQVRNPHVLDRNPSGSSSGSGAAVAAHLAPLAVGTETDGSVLCPASACGIVGVKPTVGLVSRSGIVPISHVQDTAGPMTATVADAALLLAVLAGADPADPAVGETDAGALDAGALAVGALNAGGLGGSRLGVWRDGSKAADPRTAAVLDEAVAVLRARGAQLIDPVDLPGSDEIEESEFTALCHEFKHDMNAYLATLGGGCPRTLSGLIEFNERNAATVMAGFGQDVFERAEATSGDLADEAYLAARSLAGELARRALDTPIESHGLDAVVALTANPAWPIDPVLGDRDVFHTSPPAAVAGHPAVTVPAGMVRGLPVGLTFMGPAWSEQRLLALAYAFEQASGVRRAPAYRATIDIA
ncbi:MAG: amidase [Micromonosporaceae bacterium]